MLVGGPGRHLDGSAVLSSFLGGYSYPLRSARSAV